MSSGLGAGQRRWAIFSGSIYVHDGGVATVSHFPKLKSELELLGSECNADLIEDEADGLWTRVNTTSNSLVSYVPSSVAHDPPEGAGE
jgi:hypothetical protein